MTQKRFSLLHLLLAVVLTLGVTVGGSLLALRLTVGEGALSLLEGLMLVNTRFVGEYEPVEAVDAALEGMVKGLGDRWSYYLNAEAYEAQNLRRKNQYVGIGVTVSYEREEGLLILEVTPGSPAEEAGLLPGEVITRAEGVSLAGEGRYQGSEYIRGEAGTTAVLEVLGTGGTTRTVEVRREAVATDPVSYEMLEDSVGYVKLANFYENSAQRLKEAVEDLQAQGARALVFDMRNNGGGYLTQLTEMLDFLLPEGPIFISRSRSGREEVIQSDAACVDLPMAVLVNEDTYSAAEFFAAQLQEDGAAVIVGVPTSGKGYSQQTFPLPHGGALNISTAAYFTGDGTSLIGTGLRLDAQVEQTEEGDAQLEAALALLQG
ncbi:MAG: PDZ domain-containing protein [Flavonifractor sp.]|jgi:carboxyl-terminal processing protease|nr:PDZ domain-containing protein [Flavonifractor sp.]